MFSSGSLPKGRAGGEAGIFIELCIQKSEFVLPSTDVRVAFVSHSKRRQWHWLTPLLS